MTCKVHWRRAMILAALLGVAAGTAQGEPYWIAYEGNEFPEEVGWRRIYGNEHGPFAGGAERNIRDGVFTLNSMRHDQIVDFYDVRQSIDPAPGELFTAEWRVLVDPVSDPGDAGVIIARDDPPGYLAVKNGPYAVVISPGNVLIELKAGDFHWFTVRSVDMQRFELSIDGEPAYSGFFESNTLLQSFVAFGDSVQGQRSLTCWDYVRFGVVPEPATLSALLACAFGLSGRVHHGSCP